MKKDVKSGLTVKNWQEPINWYEPTEERCKYLEIPGIPQKIWVTEEFYKTYKKGFIRLCERKISLSYCMITKDTCDFCEKCSKCLCLCKKNIRMTKDKQNRKSYIFILLRRFALGNKINQQGKKVFDLIKKIVWQIIIRLIVNEIYDKILKLFGKIIEFFKDLF